MVVRLVAFTAADRFFNLIMGRKRNKVRNAAGLVLKLRIFVVVQDLIISFYTQKVQFILVLPRFWLVFPHFVCSGDGTG